MTINEQIAFAAGYNAAIEGKRRAPATCKVWAYLVETTCAGQPIGTSIPLSKAWMAGYEARINEECAAILAA